MNEYRIAHCFQNMDQKRLLVGNQEEESTGIPTNEVKIKKSSRSLSVRFYRFPILAVHYQTSRSSSTTAIDASPKNIQEQTPVSMSEELDLSLWFTANNKKRKITAAENNNPKRPKLLASGSDSDSVSDSVVAAKLLNMRKYSKEDAAEEDRLGVTTKLSLYDPWRMKKGLTQSDIGNLSRLMLKTDWVEKYFLPRLNVEQVESESGVPVRVLDLDTDSEHELVFKLWKSSSSFILNNGWVKEFVKRRNLKRGDQIGMVCNGSFRGRMSPHSNALRIFFCVLKRAN